MTGNNYNRLEECEITNQCVVLCDLKLFKKDVVKCWSVVKGTQEDIGKIISKEMLDNGITRVDDFGGVCKTFLCDDESYKQNPPKTKSGAMIFSFTPKNKCISEGSQMAKTASSSGYEYMVITLQKKGKFGKVWVLSETLKNITDFDIEYYEDTSDIIDELRQSISNHKLYHVLAPEFQHIKSIHANKEISQEDYIKDVLVEEFP